MDGHRFPADDTERDGAAAEGWIVVSPDIGSAIGNFADSATGQPGFTAAESS